MVPKVGAELTRGHPPPVFEDQQISDIHCAVITDLVEHNVPVPGLVDVLFITGTENDSVLGGGYPELQGRSSHTGTANPEPVCGHMSAQNIFWVNQVPYLFLSYRI